MSFIKLGSAESTRDAVSRCNGTHNCAQVASCGANFDTAGINAESYEAVKKAYTPASP